MELRLSDLKNAHQGRKKGRRVLLNVDKLRYKSIVCIRKGHHDPYEKKPPEDSTTLRQPIHQPHATTRRRSRIKVIKNGNICSTGKVRITATIQRISRDWIVLYRNNTSQDIWRHICSPRQPTVHSINSHVKLKCRLMPEPVQDCKRCPLDLLTICWWPKILSYGMKACEAETEVKAGSGQCLW